MGTVPEPRPARTMDRRAVILAVVAAVAFGLVQFRPIHDVDLFWQVRSGELILDSGVLPAADPFTSTHAGEPNPQIYWLSQVFYAGFLRVAGWPWLHAVDSLLFVAAFVIVAAAARGQSTHPLPVIVAFVIAVIVSIPHHSLRPQTFGLFGFAFMVRLDLASVRPVVRAVLLVAVVVVWQNLHPSATVALGYLGAKAMAAWWRWLLGREPGIPVWPSVYPVIVAVLLPLTPTGFDIFRVSAANAEVSRLLGIEEWLPIWHPATWGASRLVWGALVATTVLAAANIRRLRADDVFVAVVFTVAAIVVYRLSLFWCVVMIPVWARWLDAAWPKGLFEVADGRVSARVATAALTVAYGVAAAGPMLIGAPLFDSSIPLAGVRRVAELGVTGVVYNYREWGGPLVWANHPRVRVTIDGRLYLFPRGDWDHYIRAASGEVPIDEIETRFRPDAFFLRPQYHTRLIERIRASGRWDEVYHDNACVIFLPKRGEP